MSADAPGAQVVGIGDRLSSDILVRVVEGPRIRVGAFFGNPLVIHCLRHYGSDPCCEFLRQIQVAWQDIYGWDARVIAVGTGTALQARRLMDRGVPFPCLIDPDTNLYAALGLGPTGRGWRRRWPSRGWQPVGARRRNGVTVVDRDGRICYLHRAERPGEYPPLEDVLTCTRALAEVAPTP